MNSFKNRNNRAQGQEEIQTQPGTDQLSAQIDQMEAEIDSLYADIGKEYYAANPDNPMSEGMAACYREIDERKAKIQEATDQIRTLKGITTCEYCGADISVNDTFCASCGARIISEITVSPAGGICPNCGHRVEPGKQFCSTCGAKVNISESARGDDILYEKTIVLDPVEPTAGAKSAAEGFVAEEAAATENIAENAAETGAAAAAGETRFCMNCGAVLEEGMLFCINCGTPVEGAEGAAAAAGSAQPAPAQDASAGGTQAFCTNCGAPLDPNDKFCINCGQPVEQ